MSQLFGVRNYPIADVAQIAIDRFRTERLYAELLLDFWSKRDEADQTSQRRSDPCYESRTGYRFPRVRNLAFC